MFQRDKRPLLNRFRNDGQKLALLGDAGVENSGFDLAGALDLNLLKTNPGADDQRLRQVRTCERGQRPY
jgi:hypothetical protein